MMTKKQSNKFLALSFIPIAAILVALLYGFTCNHVKTTTFPQPESKEAATETTTFESFASPTTQKDSTICLNPTNMAIFPGGSIQSWIAQNVKYPAGAISQGIQGKVFVEYIIERDGSVSHIEVVRGVTPILDAEAVRVIKAMPKWKPATEKGETVRASYTMLIHFQLASNSKEEAPKADDPDDIFQVVEKMPSFPSGSIQQWIGENIKYPTNAEKNKIQGKVFIQYIVEKDGTITNIKVIRSIHPELDAEALRVIKSMPKWKPGTPRGIPVRVSYTIPIHFQLASEPKEKAPETVTSDEVFQVVEKMPLFPGGNLAQWIGRNIKYPEYAVKNKIQGKVFAQYIIEKDGTITNIKIVKSIHPELDAEVIRVVQSMPKWIPGTQKGQPVRVSYICPIMFQL